MIGDQIAAIDDKFADMFERDAEIRNYVDPTDADGVVETDEYGKPVDGDGNYGAELDESIAATAQLEQPREPEYYSRSFGVSTPVEAEILISSDLPVETADGGSYPYATEIVIGGDVYRAVHAIDEGNGAVRVFGEQISGVRA